jgi:hypothetical protein
MRVISPPQRDAFEVRTEPFHVVGGSVGVQSRLVAVLLEEIEDGGVVVGDVEFETLHVRLVAGDGGDQFLRAAVISVSLPSRDWSLAIWVIR